MAQLVTNPDQPVLNRAEFQFFKAYVRYQLSLRGKKPAGANEGLLDWEGKRERRLEIEAMANHMLRGYA